MMQESYAYSESMPRFETEDEALFRSDTEAPRNYFGRKASMEVRPSYEKQGYEKEGYQEQMVRFSHAFDQKDKRADKRKQSWD